jgi:hypothetical protein
MAKRLTVAPPKPLADSYTQWDGMVGRFRDRVKELTKAA